MSKVELYIIYQIGGNDTSDMVIQALLAERDGEQKVNVVTEEWQSEYYWIHDRWPRLRKIVASD